MSISRWRSLDTFEDDELLRAEPPSAIPLGVPRRNKPVDELYIVLRDQALEANARATQLTEKLDRLKERHQEDQAKIAALQARVATLEALLAADRAAVASASQHYDQIETALADDRVVVVHSSERLVKFGGRSAVVRPLEMQALLAVLGTSGVNSSPALERIAGLLINKTPGANWRAQWTNLRYRLGREGINADEFVVVRPRSRKSKSTGGYEALVGLRVVEE